MGNTLAKTDLADFKLVYRGKVRDVYAVNNDRLLLVATDRISAFDKILATCIPMKGIILSRLSSFWFQKLAKLVPNHWIAGPYEGLTQLDNGKTLSAPVAKRSMLVKKQNQLKIECIVRGYLVGSAWRDYHKNGMLNGIALPACLKENERFEKPMFTPSTKASDGLHDAPVTQQEGEKLVGKQIYAQLKELSIMLYQNAFLYLQKKGLILVDTKFEFGISEQAGLTLIDEVFTPDSSRFWDLESQHSDKPKKHYDKEYLRKWLLQNNLSEESQIKLPIKIINDIQKRYTEIYERVVGKKFNG